MRGRIVLAASDLEIGGAERNVVTYACALRGRGHDVAVAAGPGPLAAELEACGVPRIDVRPHLRRPGSILAAARGLRAAHRAAPIAVVHAFMGSASFAAGLGRAGVRRPYRLVAAPPGLSQGRDEPAWLARLRLRLLALWADAVLVPSPDLRRAVEGFVPAGRLRDVAFNTVDLARADAAPPLPRSALGLSDGDRVVCSVARLHPVKGQDLLVRAMPRVLARVPRARLLLVGDGPQRRALEQLVADLALGGRVVFAGARTDVPSILLAVDVVVQTTFGTGGPGLAVLEAFAARRPVVGLRFRDLVEAVGGTGAAVLVEHGDVNALGDAVAGVLADAPRAKDMGLAGRRLVEDRFSVTAAVDALERVYHEVAGVRTAS